MMPIPRNVKYVKHQISQKRAQGAVDAIMCNKLLCICTGVFLCAVGVVLHRFHMCQATLWLYSYHIRAFATTLCSTTKTGDGSLYLGDTRPEFKIWGGASKSVFVLLIIYLSTPI